MDEHPKFEVEVQLDPPDTGRLVVRGEVDLATGPLLGVSLNRAVHAGCRHLVIDLTETSLLTAAGVRELVAARRHLEEEPSAEVAIAIAGPTPCVRRVIDLCGMGDLLVDAAAGGGTVEGREPGSDDEAGPAEGAGQRDHLGEPRVTQEHVALDSALVIAVRQRVGAASAVRFIEAAIARALDGPVGGDHPTDG